MSAKEEFDQLLKDFSEVANAYAKHLKPGASQEVLLKNLQEACKKFLIDSTPEINCRNGKVCGGYCCLDEAPILKLD